MARKALHGDLPHPKKVHFLFARLPPDVIARLQVDAVAGYSVTDARTAQQTTELLLRLPGIPRRGAKIVDGTACVGGNTISFAVDGFGDVVAVELDGCRCDMLQHNIEVVRNHYARQPNVSFCSVKVLRANILELLRLSHESTSKLSLSPDVKSTEAGMHTTPLATADILFLDPPWGGTGYGDAGDNIDLSLGDVPIPELCSRVLTSCLLRGTAAGGATGSYSYVALKLPVNFNVKALSSAVRDAVEESRHNGDIGMMQISDPMHSSAPKSHSISGIDQRSRIIVFRHLRKMLLIVIDCRSDDKRLAQPLPVPEYFYPSAKLLQRQNGGHCQQRYVSRQSQRESGRESESSLARLASQGEKGISTHDTAPSNGNIAWRSGTIHRAPGGWRSRHQATRLTEASVYPDPDKSRNLRKFTSKPRDGWKADHQDCWVQLGSLDDLDEFHHLLVYVPGFAPYGSPAAFVDETIGRWASARRADKQMPSHAPRGGFMFVGEGDRFEWKHAKQKKGHTNTSGGRTACGDQVGGKGQIPKTCVVISCASACGGSNTVEHAATAYAAQPVEMERQLLVQIDACLRRRAAAKALLAGGLANPTARDARDEVRIAFPQKAVRHTAATDLYPPLKNGCIAVCGPLEALKCVVARRDIGALHSCAPETLVLCVPISEIAQPARHGLDYLPCKERLKQWCAAALASQLDTASKRADFTETARCGNFDGPGRACENSSCSGVGKSVQAESNIDACANDLVVSMGHQLNNLARRLALFCDADWAVIVSVANWHDASDDRRSGGRGVFMIDLPGGRRHLGETAIDVALRRMVEECGIKVQLTQPASTGCNTQGSVPSRQAASRLPNASDETESSGDEYCGSDSRDNAESFNVEETAACTCQIKATLLDTISGAELCEDASGRHRRPGDSMTYHIALLDE